MDTLKQRIKMTDGLDGYDKYKYSAILHIDHMNMFMLISGHTDIQNRSVWDRSI